MTTLQETEAQRERKTKAIIMECGFGHRNGRGGKAQILAEYNGEKPNLALTELGHDLYLGGRTIRVALNHMKENAKPYISTGKLWKINLERNGNSCFFRLTLIDPAQDAIQFRYIGEANGFLKNNELHWAMDGSEGEDKVIGHLSGELGEACLAAISRSEDPQPHRIYWGTIAKNTPVIKQKTKEKGFAEVPTEPLVLTVPNHPLNKAWYGDGEE